jgi:hypothetical protein
VAVEMRGCFRRASETVILETPRRVAISVKLTRFFINEVLLGRGILESSIIIRQVKRRLGFT